jgi:starch-binding outer membrane protein, SusD/RagB family
METNKSYIAILALSFLLVSGCNKVLDKTPVDKFSEAILWTDVNLADKNLMSLYNQSLFGGFGYLPTASLTDESHDTHEFGTQNYLLGNINSSNTSPLGDWGFQYLRWDILYSNIQKLNVFLANIDKVPGAYPPAEQAGIKVITDRLKGEAIYLRAYIYCDLARNYGGAIINTVPFVLGEDFSSSVRSSFEATVNFIAGECDAAVALLGAKSEMEMGRANKEAALTLKSRILLFAASDLTADGTASSELVGYQSPDRTALWTAAKNAAKAVIDMNTVSLANFGAPDQAAVAQNFYNFFKAKDLSSNEVIWGRMYRKDAGTKDYGNVNQINLINGTNGFVMYGCNAPTGNLVDSFQMADGSKFLDHFKVDVDGFYKNISAKYHHENMYFDREPRFYGTILYDSVPWMKRLPDLSGRDPIGIYDRRTRVTISGGVETSKVYGIDTRQGPVDREDGTFTGYTFKKMLDNEVYATEADNNDNSWIEMRFAEIIMNYAEACLELGEIGEATDNINLIRNRAGLPNFTGDIKAALRYERQMEFVYEGIRWYDIRRWKILDKVLTQASGVDIIETHNLDNGTTTTTWRQIFVQNRGPVLDKMLWFPIPIDEMNRAPQLIQNPGY